MNREVTIGEIFSIYVDNPPFVLARMNRIGRSPKEDPMTVEFVRHLESICMKHGITVKDFRQRFLLATGTYPEYSLAGLSLAQTIGLCKSLNVDPGEVMRHVITGVGR